MKIINSLKKYFTNDEIKNNFVITSDDNSYSKINNEMLDLKIKELSNLVQGLINLTNIRVYQPDTSSNSYVSGQEFRIVVVNNIAYFTGRLVSKQALSGAFEVDLPVNLRPITDYIGIRSIILESGNEYRFQILVEKANPTKLKIYAYDEFPVNIGILISFSYPLDNNAVL